MVEASNPYGEEEEEDDWGLDYDQENEYADLAELTKVKSQVEDDGLGMVNVFQSGHGKSKHYTIIDTKDISAIQSSRVEEVSDQTGISKDLASALLLKNGWNETAAIDALLSSDNYIQATFKFSLEVGTLKRKTS